MTTPHVVIVGGGFGGLKAAQTLRGKPVRVTLIDRRNHHVFQPLLYQVATAGLSPAEIGAPIRWILRRARNVRVLLGDVTGVDLAARRVTFAEGPPIVYDYLILAPGARHAYFGHPEWEQHAPGLKTLEDAIAIRRRVLLAFERAERETDPARRDELLTFVIVGGGPTGVELAGTLAEIARHTLRHEFRAIDTSRARIVIVEAGPSMLATFPEAASGCRTPIDRDVWASRYAKARGSWASTRTAWTYSREVVPSSGSWRPPSYGPPASARHRSCRRWACRSTRRAV